MPMPQYDVRSFLWKAAGPDDFAAADTALEEFVREFAAHKKLAQSFPEIVKVSVHHLSATESRYTIILRTMML